MWVEVGEVKGNGIASLPLSDLGMPDEETEVDADKDCELDKEEVAAYASYQDTRQAMNDQQRALVLRVARARQMQGQAQERWQGTGAHGRA